LPEREVSSQNSFLLPAEGGKIELLNSLAALLEEVSTSPSRWYNEGREFPCEEVSMSLAIPDDILRAAKMSASELRQEIALLLFQQNKLTLGQASEFAGMSHLEFQRLLASRQIPIHSDAQDFSDDLDTLRQLGQL